MSVHKLHTVTPTLSEVIMTYTKSQLIDALTAEHEFYSHDTDLPMSLSDYVDYLNTLSVTQLIYETSTDDEFTLDEFMSSYV